MRRSFLDAAAMLTMAAALCSAPVFAQLDTNYGGPGTTTTTTVTSVSGTITQVNYGTDGMVDGFLIGANVLLTFEPDPATGIASLGAVGNSVTYSGAAVTSSTGFESVRVTSFTNNSTKATYTPPTTAAVPVTYGPTSGTVKQLNYDGAGNIDGFLFTPSGSSTPIVVSTGSQASATLKPLLTVGATVSVTGTSETAAATCTSTGALAVVNATSLTIGSQTIVISGGGPGGPGGPGRGGPHR